MVVDVDVDDDELDEDELDEDELDDDELDDDELDEDEDDVVVRRKIVGSVIDGNAGTDTHGIVGRDIGGMVGKCGTANFADGASTGVVG